MRGANLEEEYLLPYFEVTHATMEEVFDAMYMSGRELQLVRDQDVTRNVSDVRELWFIILGFVCIVIAALGVWSLHLTFANGLQPCANDEVALRSLLVRSATESSDAVPNATWTRLRGRNSLAVTTHGFLLVRYTEKGDTSTARDGPS